MGPKWHFGVRFLHTNARSNSFKGLRHCHTSDTDLSRILHRSRKTTRIFPKATLVTWSNCCQLVSSITNTTLHLCAWFYFIGRYSDTIAISLPSSNFHCPWNPLPPAGDMLSGREHVQGPNNMNLEFLFHWIGFKPILIVYFSAHVLNLASGSPSRWPLCPLDMSP
jgi:hypothetical protein